MSTISANTIAIAYVAQTEQARKQIDALSGKLNNFLKSNKSVGDVLGNLKKQAAETNATTALFVGGVIAAGVALTKVIQNAAEYGNELQKISNRTGVAVEELSKLKFAAEQEDVSLQEVSGSLRIVSRQAAAAAGGSKEASKAFSDLGVDVKDANGNLKAGDVLLKEIGEGLKKIPPGTERTAAGMKVLGRSAQSIIPLVTNLAELEDQAEKLGLTVSGKFARDADEFGDKLDQLKAISQRAGVAVAQVLLPALNQLLGVTIEGGSAGLKKFKKDIDDLAFSILQLSLKTQFGYKVLQIFNLQLAKFDPAFVANKVLGGADTLDENIQRLRGELDEIAKQSRVTREEFGKLGEEAQKAGDGLKGGADTVEEAAQKLKDLAESLTQVDSAISPVVTLAEKLAGVFPDLNPKFADLVTGLQGLASSGPVAAKALQDVLAVAARAQEELGGELAKSFEDLTGNEALQERNARREDRQRGRSARGETDAEALAREGEEFLNPVVDPREQADREQGVADAQKANLGFLEGIHAALQANEIAADSFNGTLEEGQKNLAAMEGFANSFGDAIFEAASGAKGAFGEFFKQLLKDLAKSIIRATILQAILGAFSGGFSLAKIAKTVAGSLGLGPLGFAHQESSLLGRAAQARGLGSLAGPALAAGGTENIQSTSTGPTIRVYEPGPFTKVEMADDVIPRLRQRRRRMNEEPF